jgi:hypothetical protein
VISHEGERQIVEAIKDFRDDCLTYRQIALRLTALKIPSKNGKKKWHPMMVKRILDNSKETKEDDEEPEFLTPLSHCKKIK